MFDMYILYGCEIFFMFFLKVLSLLLLLPAAILVKYSYTVFRLYVSSNARILHEIRLLASCCFRSFLATGKLLFLHAFAQAVS